MLLSFHFDHLFSVLQLNHLLGYKIWDYDLPGRYVAVMHVGCNHNSSSAPVALKRQKLSKIQAQGLSF